MSYDNSNTGALFKNDKKENDTHSDYNGTINVDGVEYWLNAWIKKSKAGKTYMSLSVKPKEAKKEKAQEQTRPQKQYEEFNDDIPF